MTLLAEPVSSTSTGRGLDRVRPHADLIGANLAILQTESAVD
jgi:hypothetical protein